MSLLRLVHALSTGAATFGLNPSLPANQTNVMPPRRSPTEALAADAVKLRADFQIAFGKLAEEAESSGQSVQTETLS